MSTSKGHSSAPRDESSDRRGGGSSWPKEPPNTAARLVEDLTCRGLVGGVRGRVGAGVNGNFTFSPRFCCLIDVGDTGDIGGVLIVRPSRLGLRGRSVGVLGVSG